VDRKPISDLTCQVGPHGDSVLSILCAQSIVDKHRGQNYAQIHAVLRRLAQSPDKRVRDTILRQDKNGLSALEIAAIKNKAVVACHIIEIIYSMTENIEAASDFINCRDQATGTTILHILARKGDINFETTSALLNIELTDGSSLIKILPNKKNQTPIHIVAQSKSFQPLTMKLFHDKMPNCFQTYDKTGLSPLGMACQRSNDVRTISFILSHNKDNINLPDKQNLTCVDHLLRRGETPAAQKLPQKNFLVEASVKTEMLNLLRNNGGKTSAELTQLDLENTSILSGFQEQLSETTTETSVISSDPFISSLMCPSPGSPSSTQTSSSSSSPLSSTNLDEPEDELESLMLFDLPDLSGLLDTVLEK